MFRQQSDSGYNDERGMCMIHTDTDCRKKDTQIVEKKTAMRRKVSREGINKQRGRVILSSYGKALTHVGRHVLLETIRMSRVRCVSEHKYLHLNKCRYCPFVTLLSDK